MAEIVGTVNDQSLALWKALTATPIVGMEVETEFNGLSGVTLVMEDGQRVRFWLGNDYDPAFTVSITDPTKVPDNVIRFGQV